VRQIASPPHAIRLLVIVMALILLGIKTIGIQHGFLYYCRNSVVPKNKSSAF
jgi:hypothetical protein